MFEEEWSIVNNHMKYFSSYVSFDLEKAYISASYAVHKWYNMLVSSWRGYSWKDHTLMRTDKLYLLEY